MIISHNFVLHFFLRMPLSNATPLRFGDIIIQDLMINNIIKNQLYVAFVINLW